MVDCMHHMPPRVGLPVFGACNRSDRLVMGWKACTGLAGCSMGLLGALCRGLHNSSHCLRKAQICPRWDYLLVVHRHTGYHCMKVRQESSPSPVRSLWIAQPSGMDSPRWDIEAADWGVQRAPVSPRRLRPAVASYSDKTV